MTIRRRVVVTGLGAVSPLGLSMSETWTNIIAGKSGLRKIERPGYEKLPCKVAGFVKTGEDLIDLTKFFGKTELKTVNNATAFALIAAKEALADAKLTDIDDEMKLKTGVAIGMGIVDLEDISKTSEALNRSYNQVSPFFIPRILPNMSAGHISIKYGLRGPNHAVSTACATGLHAIGDSYRFIRNGDAEIMVCGGTEACISPLSIAGFCRLRALSTTFNDDPLKASRPFDRKRDGFVMSEGSAILILENLENALKRNVPIYAEILGYGLSGDASHMTAPREDGFGAYLAMDRALKDAGITSEDVSYINAHATSTPIGDVIEIKAIKQLRRNNVKDLAVSSTKGAHGHLLGSAGNLEAALTIKAIQNSVIPPTINLENPEETEINFVPNVSQNWMTENRKVALKNAFGFGGTNASLCIGEFIK